MPQPSDLRLAAALVVKGYATREAIEECLKIQEKYAAAGKPISLERVIVGKGVAKDTVVRHVRRGEGLLAPGEKIADHALVKKVGEGGMSYVFEATPPGSKSSVAIKVMKPHLATDPAAVQRFRNEAKLLIRLEHPNLTRGVSLGEVDGAPFFVMEFVDGDTILNIVEQSGTFGEDAALYIVMQIADALDYLFSQGIVHRDVKPANILLKRDNTVKLCDLGLATEARAASAPGSRDDRSDTTVGTVHYISPEQAAGQNDVDVRSDIYSLGVTLYHIVVGELPFSGSDDSDVMRRQILDGLSASRLRGKDVSPHMHYFLEKMMAKERDVRYQSPRELVEDIREHIRGKKTLTFNPRYESSPGDVDVEKPYGDAAPADPTAKKARDAGSKSTFFRFRRGRGPT